MGKNLRLTIASLAILAVYMATAQVAVKIDSRIDDMVYSKNAIIDSTSLSGFRIQIASSSNANVTRAAKAKFRRLYPEYSDRAYDLYQQPYHKVRVGDFYREIDAQKLLREIIDSGFREAFLVRDKIRRPKL